MGINTPENPFIEELTRQLWGFPARLTRLDHDLREQHIG
jgi:hypothetical protein